MATDSSNNEPVFCSFCGVLIAPEDVEAPEYDPADVTSIPQYQEALKETMEFRGTDIHVCKRCRRGILENDVELEREYRSRTTREQRAKAVIIAVLIIPVAAVVLMFIAAALPWLFGWR